MIVHAAGLADFPADGHALENVVLEDEVARVIPFREKQIPVERFRVEHVGVDVVLDFSESEVALGDGGKAFDPVEDGQPVVVTCLCIARLRSAIRRVREIRKEL